MVIFNLHDQAVLVLLDRSPLHRLFLVLLGILAGSAAVLIVGQGNVDLLGVWVDLHILRTVHLGGAHLIGGLTGVDSNLFGRHAINVGLELVVLRIGGQQLDPFALAVKGTILWQHAGAVNLVLWGVALYLGHVQGAVVQDGEVVLDVAFFVLLGGDELVDVLEAGVIAGVAHDGAIGCDVDVAGLVLEATQRGVLDRGGLRVQRVDFYDPAKAVRLVRLLGDVEALVKALPLALGLAVFHAEALQGLLRLLVIQLGVGEVLVKVLFARKHGIPRSDAAGAIIQGALDLLAGLIGGGLDVIGAGSWAHQGEFGGGGDAAVERAELTLELAGLANLRYLHDGVAVASPADLGLLLGGVIRIVVGEHLRLGGVLVGADVDKAVVIVRVLDKARKVIVEAELLLSCLGGLVLVIEFRRVLKQRVAPGNEDGLLVAIRDDHFVLLVWLYWVELHALCGGELNVRLRGFAALALGGRSLIRRIIRVGAGRQSSTAANGYDGQAARTQRGTAGELVSKVRVIGLVLALAKASITALVGAGQAGTRGGKETREKVAAFKRHYYCSKEVRKY